MALTFPSNGTNIYISPAIVSRIPWGMYSEMEIRIQELQVGELLGFNKFGNKAVGRAVEL